MRNACRSASFVVSGWSSTDGMESDLRATLYRKDMITLP